MATPPFDIGVLSFHESKETKAICNAIEALGHNAAWFREENTEIHLGDDGIKLEPAVDIVINRLLLSNTPQPSELVGIAETISNICPILNPPRATAIASHKIASASRLVRADLPVPKTIFALSGDRLNSYRESFGAEAVYKTAIGTHGGGAWKIDTTDVLSPTVGHRRAFLQTLINTPTSSPEDVRVYVVNGNMIAAMKRYASPNDWRTNVSRGGSVEDVTDSLPEQVKTMALNASEVLGLDYAGVDLIEGSDGWYILEVNPTAGFRGLYRATGVSPAPYIAKLAIEELNGSVDSQFVEELSATLDDSKPTCMPRPSPSRFEDPVVIGLTERVIVTGTSGRKSVIGKCDSGATRTSIDLQLAADIGAGPIHTVRRVRTGSQPHGKSRPVVDLVLGIGGTQHTVEANIEDRSHMNYPLLIGRDVLKDYFLDVSRRVDANRGGLTVEE